MKLGFRVWLLIICVIISLLFIFGLPPKVFDSGVLVTSVESNSSLFNQGLRAGSVINSIDGEKVTDINSYSNAISGKFVPGINTKLTIGTNSGTYAFYGENLSELSVSEIPKTNLKLGLDLSGGARALIKAENKSLSSGELSDLVEITQNRLNAFGLSDLKVSPVSDLSGNNFMLIEIAGTTPKDLRELISEQGKFEAKIGNVTVFEGGSRDISSVGRDAQNARIESCVADGSGGYICRFNFAITLSAEAAERHANITADIPVEGGYLTETLDLFVDDRFIESLQISSSLKGRVTTQISISGSGVGETQDEALLNAKSEMKKLQTILMTGGLPYKLEIVKLDTISPLLGSNFTNYILIAGLVAVLSVIIIIYFRYRRWKFSVSVVAINFSEIIITLGIAALIQWNLDLPSIAGILAAIGTGIDDLIVLIDETGGRNLILSIKERIKRALTIIFAAYFTALVSLLPLLWAGAGLLKGFAITTIIGISAGVFITRPAFAELLKRFREKSER